MLQVALAPSVLAEPVERTQMLYIDPDPDAMVWNDTFNVSDPSSSSLLNYEQTIKPFMDETNITGTFTGTYLPPMIWEVSDNNTFDGFSFFQLVRFKSEWIMSGSSVSWWRIPVLNITDWNHLIMVIQRIGNPGMLTIGTNPEVGSLNEMARSVMIYQEHYYSESRNESWYEQNITAWDQDLTFYWLRVDAPIHADAHYLVQWYINTSTTVEGIRCLFAQTDLSDDQIFESQFYFGDGIETVECDLDISVIHQYGMGHTVSGWEVGSNQSIQFYSRLSEPVTQSDDNITFMMPFVQDITNASNAQVTIQNVNKTFDEFYWVAEDGPTDFTLKSYQWGFNYPNTVFWINVTFQNQSNMIWLHDMYSDLDPWAPTTNKEQMFYYGVSDDMNASGIRKVWFRPYHAMQKTDGQWTNTIISPLYYLDGRLVDPDALKMKTTHHSDPWYIWVAKGIIEIPFYIYQITDFIFFDLLPDLDRETYWGWFNDAATWLKNTLNPIFVLAGYFVQAVKFLIEHGSEILAGIARGLALIIFIPLFAAAVLLTNGVKRFMVIIARDGFEPAVEYANNFFKNSLALTVRRGI